MDWKIRKASSGLKGELALPPDKSISHRSVMFASISGGRCCIRNFLLGEDCMRTLEAFRAMGVEISVKDNMVTVHGRGLKGLKEPQGELYLGNSGTTMRIISGILAGQDFTSVLTGDESLSRRPMRRIIEPLSLMGARIESAEGTSCAPLRIKGKTPLNPIDYSMPIASAQVKSCVLAAGLYANGKTSVSEPFQSRDHTERMLEYFSADIKREGLTTEITGLEELAPKDLEIPADISSAAFFIVAALLVKGSRLIMRGVGLNPTRIGIINVLKRMGASIQILDCRESLEPAGDIEVRHSDLKGTVVEEEEIPLLIDEIPVLTVAAAMAEGTTVIKGIKELKVKETDRAKSVIENLSRMGIRLEEEEDTLIIPGKSVRLNAAELDSFGDHRTAMSMAVAGLVSEGTCLIRDTACVDTSYPGFFADLEKLVRHV
ncbi:MAG: 3-phosphoshikimate 1-carboxyvinyltransferase [Candidatus Omnitrophota bacterium]